MFKKAILVVLCLVVRHECHVIQTKEFFNFPDSFTKLISDGIENEIKKCNINISDDVFYLCRRPFNSVQKTSNYFDYEEAVCITLYDSVEHLCNSKNLTKLHLEESSPIVTNVTAFCSKMRSTLNDSLSYTKDSERKEWISELRNRLNDEQMCKEACIHVEKVRVVSPVCSTLLQINAYLNFNLPEKQSTSETSRDAEKTSLNKSQDVQVVSTNQKAAVDLHVEDIPKESKAIPENTSVDKGNKLDVQQVEGFSSQQNPVSSGQEGDTRGPSIIENSLKSQQNPVSSGQEGNTRGPSVIENSPKETEHSVSITTKTENNDKVEKKENSNIPMIKHKSVNGRKHNNNNNNITTTTNTTTTTIKDNTSNIQETSNNRVTNQLPSSNDQEINELSKIKTSLNPNNPNEGPTLNKSSTNTKESVKEPEKKKQLPIAEETDKKTVKPSSKPADINKETNMDKPPTDPEDSETSKGKSSDVKTENSPEVPQDSKTENSVKQKIANDISAKKMSLPKTDDDTEPAQAQSPDTEPEITDKDQSIIDANTLNEENGEQNMGDNQGPIDMDGENNFGSDDDDDIMTQKTNTLPEIDDDDIGMQEKGAYIQDKFVNAEDSHFFAYFMTMMIICIVGYLVYHNKQKILALALEGRSRRSTRRRPNTSGYRKLDSNLEEAVTSACSTSVTHVIY